MKKNSSKSQLMVIDSYALFFRAYYAFIRNPLTVSYKDSQQNISALFGFFRALLQLLRTYSPDYCIITLDSSGNTFRNEIYPLYKANREEAPDDLKSQFPLLYEALDALEVPYLVAEGYEADDIIASIATSVRGRSDMECAIVSSDKDLMQLVGDNVYMLRPGKNGYVYVDAAYVHEEKGVHPHQILDYLALVGDSADNIPGVKGIGEKTAGILLQQYSSLDEIYAQVHNIASGRRLKLVAGKELAYLSKQLARLQMDFVIPQAHADYHIFAVSHFNITEFINFLRMLHMNTLAHDYHVYAQLPFDDEMHVHDDTSSATHTTQPVIRSTDKHAMDMDAVVDSETVLVDDEKSVGSSYFITRPDRTHYQCVTTLEGLALLEKKLLAAQIFAIDLETTSLVIMDAQIIGISFSCVAHEAFYVPIIADNSAILPQDAVFALLRSVCEDENTRLIGQNIKYDYQVLRRMGIHMRTILFDTMIAAWLFDTTKNQYNMDDLAFRYLGETTTSYSELFENAKIAKTASFAHVSLEHATHYACEDADVTYRLYMLFDAMLDKRNLRTLFETIEMPLVPILANMEYSGIRLDVAQITHSRTALVQSQAILQEKIFSDIGHEINLASPKQLQTVLFDELHLKPGKKTKTGYSTNEAELLRLAYTHEVPALILEWRGITKLLSTYIDALPHEAHSQTGRIHSNFQQTGTATGRLSSSQPNLQNIPIRTEIGRHIRECFIPEAQHIFVSADYAQIELVVLAHLSEDAGLSAAFVHEEDVHVATAAFIFNCVPEAVSNEQRQIAKAINFGVLYGMSAHRLSRELKITHAEAKLFLDNYFERYQAIREFIEKTIIYAQKHEGVHTIAGRFRPIPLIHAHNYNERMSAERIAVNTCIQGSAADIVKCAMIHIDHLLRAHQLQTKLILQVHDELIFEVPVHEEMIVRELVRDAMQNAYTLSVPLRVNIETGASWGAIH